MKYCSLENDFYCHPKLDDLSRLLGVPKKWADAYIHGTMAKLYSWCAGVRPGGDLTKFSLARIESVVGWRGKRGEWLTEAIRAGLIDVSFADNGDGAKLADVDPEMRTVLGSALPDSSLVLIESRAFTVEVHGFRKRNRRYLNKAEKRSRRNPDETQNKPRTNPEQTQESTPNENEEVGRDVPPLEQNRTEEIKQEQQQEEATTQIPVPHPDAPEPGVVDPVPPPVPLEQPPATQLDHMACEAPAVEPTERRAPEPTPGPVPAVTGNSSAVAWTPADGARSWREYNSWMASGGMGPARDNEKNRTSLDYLLPLSAAELKESVRVMREEKASPNGGLGLVKLKQLREKPQVKPPPHANSPTAEDVRREAELKEDMEHRDPAENVRRLGELMTGLGIAVSM